MELARHLILIVAAVIAVAALARRLGRTAPLLLVVAGFGASFVPGVHEVRIEPDVVLIGLLPPLLYAAAIRTSLIDFRQNARPIALLSVGLVAFTMFGAGLVAWWLLPITLPAALALGAVVAPPDAVAATAVARRVGMPRRIVTILEGESLVNDATAIVGLRSAVAAITGSVTAFEVADNLARSILGGVAVGVAAAIVFGKIRVRVKDVVTDTTLSLLCPFAVYLVAEEVHGSGVLAVVVAGLLLGNKAHVIQSAPSRVMERGNWATVQFVLENAVFFLIGLQGRTIFRDLGDSDLGYGRMALAAGAVLVAVIVLRFVWVIPATYVPRRLLPSVARRDPAPPISYTIAIGWAGMRGAVTLAAVFVLPEETPYREVLVLIALVVAAGTLLLEGSTLPWVVRRLGLHGPDPAQDTLIEARLHQQSAAAGFAALQEVLTGDEPAEVVDRLRQRGFDRANSSWERLGGAAETPAQLYARLRAHMLEAERAALLDNRRDAGVPDEVLRRVLDSLDVEESVLIRVAGEDSAQRETELVPHAATNDTCAHISASASEHPAPNTPAGCEECLAAGGRWVHLRLCLECGHVGCCDSSPGKHATAHFHGTGHPVIRSFEPGEAWRWCYVDEIVG